MTRRLLIFMLAFLTVPAQATWYQVQGQASTDQSDPHQAALKDAIAQAHFYAGIRAGNGARDQLLRQYKVVSEERQQGVLKLRVLVDLNDNVDNQCWQRQPIALYRFSWATPDQAISGLVGDPGQGIAAELARLLRARQSALMPVDSIGATLDQPQANSKAVLQQLAETSGARYLLGGRLVRIADSRQDAPWYKPWQSDQHRISVAIDTWLIDSFSGHKLFQRRYLAEASEANGINLDTQDPRFWLSPFGQALQRQLQQLVTDLEQALPCQASQWPIIAINENGLLLDAGLKAGIHPDDTFTLLHKRTMVTATGDRRQVLVPADTTLTVAWQSATQTLLKTLIAPEQANIQVGDFVVRTDN